MHQNSEKFIQSRDGTKLFYQAWEKPDAEYGILITHGQGEYSDCYLRLIDSFKNESCSFYAFDFRGHGKSDGLRGYAKHPVEYVDDFEVALEHTLNLPQRPRKLFLFAHSMGGMIQLFSETQNYFEKKYAPYFGGQILSAPLLGVAVDVPEWKSKSAKFINRFFPKLCLHNEINPDMLTLDKKVQEEFKRDPYCHHKISAGVFLGFFDFFAEIKKSAANIKLPTYVFLAEKDQVVSTPDTIKFFETLGAKDKTLKIYPKGTHEMVNSVEREEVFSDLKGHLKKWL